MPHTQTPGAAPSATAHQRAASPRMTADERRVEIVEAAVTAFASGGLAGTSTDEIARIAGVSQPYLFRLFGTKRGLFLAAVARMFDRIEGAFEEAAARPDPDATPPGIDPVLYSVARVYHGLLRDRSLLRLQLQAFAACDDPEVRAYVRGRFSGLVLRVAEVSGAAPAELQGFFAEGMLMNVAAAMELTDADVAWQRICEGGSER
jgi:AcrR family transcriptional regulator